MLIAAAAILSSLAGMHHVAPPGPTVTDAQVVLQARLAGHQHATSAQCRRTEPGTYRCTVTGTHGYRQHATAVVYLGTLEVSLHGG